MEILEKQKWGHMKYREEPWTKVVVVGQQTPIQWIYREMCKRQSSGIFQTRNIYNMGKSV